MHKFTVSLHAKPHVQDASVFSCNLPPVFCQRDQDLFSCYNSNMAVEWILKSELEQNTDPGEEHFPTAPTGSQTYDL